ncbi:hypothetical protein D806_046620 [Mycolicibacterium smegmatis MKD8]|uniref:Uncharacterized protein n=1 Tax=Mycolicibacterium smegmatis (strain MKD8) TaxID=1214915 RepID=A0A2U9PUY3_MYCSE|nr:hypothetical protein D806_046620 [Mycolicibacterium smegmatis MKD8]
MSLFRPRISSRRQTASRRLRRAHPACCSVTRPARSRFPASVPQEQSDRSATYPDADPAARGGSVRPPARRRHAISTGTGSRSRPAVGWESRTPRIGSVRMPRVRRPSAGGGHTLPRAAPAARGSKPRSTTILGYEQCKCQVAPYPRATDAVPASGGPPRASTPGPSRGLCGMAPVPAFGSATGVRREADAPCRAPARGADRQAHSWRDPGRHQPRPHAAIGTDRPAAGPRRRQNLTD